MSNRYVDINRECVVSRLSELAYAMELHYPGFENARLEYRKDGCFMADPGQYRILR